jgi:hypothetical protein
MSRFAFAGPLLLLVAVVTSGCGGGRHLQSVTLTPPAADAQNFPNGQVPFVATGTYSKAPSPVNLTSKDVLWCVGSSDGGCVGNAKPGATVDPNGVAQCNSGFTGTATVLAGTPSLVMVNPDSGPLLKVFGSAQLTCP